MLFDGTTRITLPMLSNFTFAEGQSFTITLNIELDYQLCTESYFFTRYVVWMVYI